MSSDSLTPVEAMLLVIIPAGVLVLGFWTGLGYRDTVIKSEMAARAELRDCREEVRRLVQVRP